MIPRPGAGYAAHAAIIAACVLVAFAGVALLAGVAAAGNGIARLIGGGALICASFGALTRWWNGFRRRGY